MECVKKLLLYCKLTGIIFCTVRHVRIAAKLMMGHHLSVRFAEKLPIVILDTRVLKRTLQVFFEISCHKNRLKQSV